MRRITASLATPPFTYDVPDEQPANLMFLGSLFRTHGWLFPVFRIRRATGELVNLSANSIPGFGAAVGIWFPDQLTLPTYFDPGLLTQRLKRAALARLDELHAQVPDATQINLECHGAFSIQEAEAQLIAHTLSRQLPEPELSLADIAAGNDRYQAALAHFDDIDKFERLLHLALAMVHHMLSNEMTGLVVTDEDPCEVVPLWLRDGELPKPDWHWMGSSLFKTLIGEDVPPPVEDVEDDPDRFVALRNATVALARAPWCSFGHLRYAQASLKFPNQQGTVIHATEALMLVGDKSAPALAGLAHATRGLAWSRHRGLSPRSTELAVADLERAIELDCGNDEVEEALRALRARN